MENTNKYNAIEIANEIKKNTNKAINASKDWYLRPIPKFLIIVSMILIDGVLSYVSIYMKLSALPVLTLTITIFLSIVLNVPQGQAARHLKNYIRDKTPTDLIVFVLIEIVFVALQITLSAVKIAVAPDLVGTSATLGGTNSNGNDLLVYGVAGMLIVGSIFSSLVCFSLDMLDNDEKRNREIAFKARNANDTTKIKLKGAAYEFGKIDSSKLNETDELNRLAAKRIVDANRNANETDFRDQLETKLSPDGINDVADGAKVIISEFRKNQEDANHE